MAQPGTTYALASNPDGSRCRDDQSLHELENRLLQGATYLPKVCSTLRDLSEPPLMRRHGVIALLIVILLSPLCGRAWAGLNAWTGTGPEGAAIRAVLVVPAVPPTPSTIYVGTIGSGVFKSTNSGATWLQTDPTGPLAARTVRALVRDSAGNLYAGVDDPVDAASGGVFTSTDGGASWIALDSAPSTLTNKKVMALLYDVTTLTLYAGVRQETVGATTFAGGVFKWDGATWTLLNNGLVSDPGQCSACARRVQALAIDPRLDPPVLYAGTQGVGVYKSIDGGATWIRPSAAPGDADDHGISNQGFRSDCLGSDDLDGIEIIALAVDTTVPL